MWYIFVALTLRHKDCEFSSVKFLSIQTYKIIVWFVNLP